MTYNGVMQHTARDTQNRCLFNQFRRSIFWTKIVFIGKIVNVFILRLVGNCAQKGNSGRVHVLITK